MDLIDRQNRIALSENTSDYPELPSGDACQAIFLFSHIRSARDS